MVIREVMCVTLVVHKGVREHAYAYDSSISERLGVYTLSEVVNLIMYCKLVMMIYIEKF